MRQIELPFFVWFGLVPLIALACGDEGGNSDGSGASAGMATGGTLAAGGGQAASGGDEQEGGTPSLGGSPIGGSDNPGGGEAGATAGGAGGASGGTDLETIAASVAAVCAIGPQKCAVFDVALCELAGEPMETDPCLALYAERMDCLADLPASGFYCVEDNVIAVLPDGPCQEVMDEHETCLGG